MDSFSIGCKLCKWKKDFMDFLFFIYISFGENASNSVVDENCYMVQVLTLWILKQNLSWQLMFSTKTTIQNYPRPKKHFIFIVEKVQRNWAIGTEVKYEQMIFFALLEFENNNCVV